MFVVALELQLIRELLAESEVYILWSFIGQWRSDTEVLRSILRHDVDVLKYDVRPREDADDGNGALNASLEACGTKRRLRLRSSEKETASLN